MSELLSRYYKIEPNVKFHFTKLRTSVFNEEKYDAIIFTEDNLDYLKLIPSSRKLFTEDIKLLVNKNHPLASHDSAVLSDLKDEKLAIYTNTFMYRLKKSSPVLKEYLEKDGNIIFNSNSPLAICKFVSDENAISFIPSISWDPYPFSNLKLIDVSDWTYRRSIYVYSNIQGKKRENLTNFMDFMIAEVHG